MGGCNTNKMLFIYTEYREKKTKLIQIAVGFEVVSVFVVVLFDILVSKINLKKYFDVFLNKKTL